MQSAGEIVADVIQQEVWRGTSTTVWALGGRWPAPTITVESGEVFAARLVNNLSEPTIVHWHGLHVPANMDGHPRDALGPGQTSDYQFLVTDRAGTYWYHPHPDMATAGQVYMGMAGFFIVHDDEERALNLPSGGYDVPLLIQDRRLEGTQQIVYNLRPADRLEGYLGDTVFVNGLPDARHSVDRGLYRLRLLNGSNARIYTLAFGDLRSFKIIATDGGLLDKPYEATTIVLSPGERAEIIVDFASDLPGTIVTLVSGGYGSSGLQARPLSVLAFAVGRDSGWREPVPSTLAQIERLEPAAASTTRTFQLRMVHDNMPRHVIGMQSYDVGRVDLFVAAGAIEIWEFDNLSAIPHPMHIHNAQFQVLTRDGLPPMSPVDFGWKDTVLVNPSETVRVIVRLGNERGLYLLHCHTLEHEDHGMMMNVEFVEGATGVDHRGSLGDLDLR